MSTNILVGAKLDDIEKIKSQLENDLIQVGKAINLEISQIDINDTDRISGQIQKQLNQISKQVEFNISNIKLGNTDSILDNLNSKIKRSLNGENIKIDNNIDFEKASNDFDNILLKAKQGVTEFTLLNGELAKMNTLLDGNNNVKSTTLTYQIDSAKQVIEQYGWKVKEVNGEVVQSFELISKKIIDNKAKLESDMLSQDKYLTNLENKLNRIKELSIKGNRTNENYDNTKDLETIANLQEKINELKSKNIQLSQEEKNTFSQTVTELNNLVQKETSYAQEVNKTSKFLENQIKILESLKSKAENRGGGNQAEQSRITEEINKQINKYQELINKNEVLGNVEMNRITKTTNSMRTQTNELTKYESTFANIFNRMKDYAIGGSLIYGGIAAAKQGFNDILEVDNAMRDLKKVTNESAQEYESFKNKANDTATALGNQTQNVIKATAAFSQMSYSYKEAQELAKNSILFQNVGDINQEDASKGLISTMKAYNIQAKDSLDIIDKLNNVSNHYAISVGGLNEAIMRGGSSLSAANNNLSESIALITTANSAIQNPQKVGNSLKTISMNIRGMKEKSGDAFPKLKKMLDDTTNGAVKLTQVTKDGKEEFRSTYDIIKDLSGVWGKLNDMQRSMISEKFAGKQNGNVFESLMLNAQKDLQKIKETADNSLGSAAKEQEAYMDSLGAKLNSLKENIKGFFLDVGNTDFLKGVISGIDTLVSGVRVLTNTFGGLPTVIGMCTTAAMLFSSKTRESIKSNVPIIEELGNTFKKVFKFDKIGNVMSNQVEKINKDLVELDRSFKNGGESIVGYQGKLLGLKAKLSGVQIAMKAAKFATIAFESVLTGGLSIILSATIGKVLELANNAIHASEKLREFNEDAKKTLEDDEKTLDNAKNKFARIQQIQEQLAQTKNESEKVSLQKKLNQLQTEMAGILPKTASGLNSNNEAMAIQNALIEENIRLKEKEMSSKADETAEKNKKTINEAIDGYKKLQEEEKQLELASKRGTTSAGFHYDPDSLLGKFGIPTVKSVTSRLKDIRTQMANSWSQIMADRSAMEIKMKQGWSDKQIEDQFGVSKKKIDDFIKGLNETGTASKNAQTGLKATDKVLAGLGLSAESAENKIKRLANSFDSFRNKKKIIQDAITEFKKFGKISGDTASKIFATGDKKLISMLGDRKNFLKNMSNYAKDCSKAEQNAWNDTVKAAIESENAKTQKASIEANNRKNISQDEANVKSDTYNNDTINQGNAEDVKTQNADNGSQNRTNASANETDNKAGHYNTDVGNQGNAEGVKTTNTGISASDRTKIQGKETDVKGKQYGTDTENHGNAEKTKNTNAKNNAKSIAKKNGGLVNKLGNQYGVDNENWKNSLNAKLGAVSSFVSQAASMLGRLFSKLANAVGSMTKKGLEALGLIKAPPTDFNVDASHGSVSSGGYSPHSSDNNVDISDDGLDLEKYNPVGYGDDLGSSGGSSGSGGHGGRKAKRGSSGDSGHKSKRSSDSGGSGSHSSSSSEKVDIKDIEDEIDRYKSLQDTIDDVNNSIDEKNALEETAHGTDKLDYMKQEIDLYKDKRSAIDDLINAKKSEAKELERKLKANGFNVENGDISNYTQRLEAIKRNVNAMSNSNKAKEKAIADYKKLKETADKYFELTSKELPNLRKEWIETGKAIRETQNRIIDMMSDAEKDMTDIIKNQIEKRKKSYEDDTDNLQEQLKKQKELLDNQFDEDDYQKSLKEKQDALNKINQQIESTKRDDSSDGQARLKDLMDKQQEAEKDLNDFIRDRQKTKADEMFDKHSDEISKIKDDKLKAMEDTYTESKITELAKGMIEKGFIELDGQIIKMKDAINDYYKDQGELFSNSSIKLQEFIDKIEITKQSYKDLSSIVKNLGVENSNIITNTGSNIVNLPKFITPSTLIANKGNQHSISIKTDLHIGTLNEANPEELNHLLDKRDEKLSKEIINKITDDLNSY